MRIFNYELLKKINIDTEMLSLVSEIKELKGKQNFFNKLKKVKLDKLIELAKIQSIESSNRIEGIVTTEQRINDLYHEKTSPKNRDEEEIMGYRDVLNIIHENFEHITLTPNHILQMHRDLYRFSAGSVGGKYKVVQNYIQEENAEGDKQIRFIPLEPLFTPDAVKSICDEYGKALNLYNIEPLILIPIFVLDFLCIHPFGDGNGRISRLLILLLLYQSGFTIGKYISLEKLIENKKDKYYDTLKVSSIKWHKNKNDVIPFVKYMLQIIVAAYRDFEQRVLVIAEKKLTKADQIKELFNTHLGKLSKAEIKKLLPDISEPMIERTLRDLLIHEKIRKIGAGKNTAYVGKKL
jgi:Fic family protein